MRIGDLNPFGWMSLIALISLLEIKSCTVNSSYSLSFYLEHVRKNTNNKKRENKKIRSNHTRDNDIRGSTRLPTSTVNNDNSIDEESQITNSC